LKIHKNNKIAGRLLIASGVAFFVSFALMQQPALLSVGCALVVIGVMTFRKRNKG
jgi:hypothetical protein